MLDLANILLNKLGVYPDALMINSTGAATADGSELIAELFNDQMVGINQAYMEHAGLVPNGVTEAQGLSQMITAMQKGFNVGPGFPVLWWGNQDPSVTGHRFFLCQGQGVLVSSAPEMAAQVYVGDGNNGTAQAAGAPFFKSSLADGSNPVDGGAFIILPNALGRALRGFDPGALVDPDGASRLLGDNQIDKGQGHKHTMNTRINSTAGGSTDGNLTMPDSSGTNITSIQLVNNTITDGTNGTPRIGTETVMANINVHIGIAF